MANLIIKPTSGGSLILQDEGEDAALTIGTTGNTTLAGTANNIGTVTAGTISGGTISNAATGVNQKIFGFSAYLSTAKTVNHATWTEINTTWTEYFDTGGKFGTTTGRFTPTVVGVYHFGYTTHIDEIDDNERIIGELRRNGSDSTTNTFAKFQNRATSSNATVTASSSSLIELDADDYVSLWCYQDGGGNDPVNSGPTQFWGYYVGTV